MSNRDQTQRVRDRDKYLEEVQRAEDSLPTTRGTSRREGWRALAVCKDDPGDHWFPDARSSDKYIEQCLARCAESCDPCTVKDECLALALTERHQYGIYANTLPYQRNLMRST